MIINQGFCVFYVYGRSMVAKEKKKWKPSTEHCHVYVGCDLWTGYRFDIGFSDSLYTPLGITLYRTTDTWILVSVVDYSLH
jgi:hypothetical protein